MQNVSSAVMAQRQEARDALDDFPTPPWATRALCEFLHGQFRIKGQSVWEPAANRGYMVRPLSEYFDIVYASDVHNYGAGFDVRDFLFPADRKFDWIITNPPFRLGTEFALTAIERANVGVALLLRSVWTEGAERYRQIFERHAPAFQIQFSERVPMFRGRIDSKGSTATSYCWFVWDVRQKPHFNNTMQVVWAPPGTRRELERMGDYSEAA